METRIDKFAKKISGDIRKQRYDSQKEFMVIQEKEATDDLVRIEEQVKQLSQGEPIILIPYYIIFGKEIYSKQKKFKDLTLLNEIEILQTKWIMRGLDWRVLGKIKEMYYQPYITGNPFLMDFSLLDGNDRLN